MWSATVIEKFHNGSSRYIEDTFINAKVKIDCADLAIEYLLDFARHEKLPVGLRFYTGKKWDTYTVKPEQKNFASAKTYAKRNFGALNVIDNTVAIDWSDAKAGDLIMSKWSGSLGHTRVIASLTLGKDKKSGNVTFYQGNLPAVVPVKKTQKISDIDFGKLDDKRPRRWNFKKFR